MNNNGFSLIELAIGLALVGLFVAALLQIYDRRQASNAHYETFIVIETARAVDFYIRQNDIVACPAPLTAGPEEPDYGRAVTPCPPDLTDLPAGTCLNGVCRIEHSNGRLMLLGAFPFKSYNMTERHSLDGWNRKLTYVITEEAVAAALPSADYAVEVRDYTRNRHTGLLEEDIPEESENRFRLGFLFSHGPDGVGAHTIDGQLYQECQGEGLDIQNCNMNGIFHHSTDFGANNRAPGPEHFDDYTFIINPLSAAQIWEISKDDPNKIYNTNTPLNTSGNEDEDEYEDEDEPGGFVGIGTEEPEVNLDVAGNIRASQILSPRICNANGEHCFEVNAIAGGGMIDCSSNNAAVTGIYRNRARCNIRFDSVSAATAGSCPAGQYATGFNAGEIQCSAP